MPVFTAIHKETPAGGMFGRGGRDAMRRLAKHCGVVAAALLLAACQGGYPGSDRLATDFADVEVRRIGDYDYGDKEFQDRAMVQAFGVITEAGIAPKAIRKVTVSTPPTRDEYAFGVRPFANYRLWIAVEGCEKDLFFLAGPGGGLVTSQDRAGCLKRQG